jgi:hypothetical protein
VKRHLRNLAAAAVLSLLVVVSGAAQDTDKDRPASTGALTLESLGTLLDNMGLEPRQVKNKAGKLVGHSVRMSNPSYNFSVGFDISPNTDWMYLTIWLKVLPDPKVPVNKLAGLLGANQAIEPAFFGLDARDNQFYLRTAVYNRGIKAALIKRMLSNMERAMLDYGKYWDPKKWDKPGDK